MPDYLNTLGTAIPYVGAGLTALSALNKYLTGSKQGKLADQYGRTPRPGRTTSPYLFQNRDIASNIEGSGLPGEGFLRSRLDRAISNSARQGINAGYGAPDILATISANNSSLLDKEAELGNKGAEYRLKGEQMLGNANTVLATDEEKNFDWNKKQPYLDAMAAASALRNASMVNKANAFDEASKIPLMFTGNGNNLSNKTRQDYYDENGKYIKQGMEKSTIYDDNNGIIT